MCNANGKIVENGDTESVFDNPQHTYTQKLLSAEPEPKEDINNNEDPLIEIRGKCLLQHAKHKFL